MVTADNLNLDVLEQICSFLSEDDLPSSALVSQFFLAATTPRLYNTISYGLRHSIGYGNATGIMSPFATLVNRPQLAVHVRNIEIRTAPCLKLSPHPVFMRECRESIRLCHNLTKFKCTVSHVLPILLPSLQEKPRLRHLHVYSNLTTPQVKMLRSIQNLTNATIEFASFTIAGILVPWMHNLSNTLNHLTLYMTNDLYADVLKQALMHLPNLRSLNVIGCPKINHIAMLALLIHTPLLESLAMTTAENKEAILLMPPSLRHLKHLALDIKYTMHPPSSPPLLGSILAQFRPLAPSLTSFSLKAPAGKFEIGDTFVSQLIEYYAFTLQQLTFLDCTVQPDSLGKICTQCVHLEELHVSIPMTMLAPFAQRISQSKSLTKLVDVDNHIDHGVRALSRDDARYVMSLSASLRTIVTTHKIWTGKEDSGFIDMSLQKRYPHKSNSFWFLPRTEL